MKCAICDIDDGDEPVCYRTVLNILRYLGFPASAGDHAHRVCVERVERNWEQWLKV